MKIRDQLLVAVLTLSAVTIGLIVFASDFYFRGVLLGEMRTGAEHMQKAHAWRISSDIKKAEMVAKQMAIAVEAFDPQSIGEVESLIKKTLNQYPAIYGSTIAFEPSSLVPGTTYIAPYFHRDGSNLAYVDLANPDYNYVKWDWYKLPKNTKQGSWRPPYYDEGGGNMAMVTYSAPFFKDGKFWGVATVDITLADLTKEINDIKIGKEGFAFLLSGNGGLLTVKSPTWKIDKTIFDIATEKGNEKIKKMGVYMMSGETGFMEISNPVDGTDSYVEYGPIPDMPWSLGLVFPKQFVVEKLRGMYLKMGLLGLGGLLVMAAMLVLLSRYATKPILSLVASAKSIAAGDLSMPPQGCGRKDEIGELARAFRDMESALSDKK